MRAVSEGLRRFARLLSLVFLLPCFFVWSLLRFFTLLLASRHTSRLIPPSLSNFCNPVFLVSFFLSAMIHEEKSVASTLAGVYFWLMIVRATPRVGSWDELRQLALLQMTRRGIVDGQ